MLELPGAMPLKKFNSPSLLSYQLPTTPQLGWDFLHSLPSMLGFCQAWACAGLVSEHLSSAHSCLLVDIHHPWLLQPFLHLFHNDPWPLGERCDMVHLRLSMRSHSQHLDQLWVLVPNPRGNKGLLRWGFRYVLIYGYDKKPLGVNVILCLISRMID